MIQAAIGGFELFLLSDCCKLLHAVTFLYIIHGNTNIILVDTKTFGHEKHDSKSCNRDYKIVVNQFNRQNGMISVFVKVEA